MKALRRFLVRLVALPFLEDLLHDTRYAVRTLRKNPGFTAVAVLTLALGIGANAAIFSVIRAVLLKPPPYANANRLVLLGETRPSTPGYSGAISAPNYLDWAQQHQVFEQMAAVTGGSATLSRGTANPVFVDGRIVSAWYFDVFGLRAALGRTFAPDEDHPDKRHVVVLSHRLWTSQFGSDPAVIGEAIQLDSELYTVIGVMPAGTGVDLLDPELWRPRDLGHEGGGLTLDGPAARDRHDLNLAVAKLKHGVTLEQARTQMEMLAARLARAYPESNQGWGVRVQPWPRPVGQNFERSLYLLLVAVGMVLLIGCVNVANLAIARGAVRSHEVAIRVALGACRGRLIRQFLTESLAIAITGGLCGLAVGYAALTMITEVIPSDGIFKVVPAETKVAMDASVWLVALGLSLFTAILFGFLPALRATRLGVVRASRTDHRFGHGLVIAELALAFILLTSAGLLVQSVFALQRQVDSGFDSKNVLTAGLPIPTKRFDNPEILNVYLDEIAARIQSVPGVRDVAFTEGLPTQGAPFVQSFQVADQPHVQRARRPVATLKIVSPSYFRAVQLRILNGRALSDGDRAGTPFVVVVNETFARTYFSGVNPIGKRLLMGVRRTGPVRTSGDDLWEVVGVVADESLSPWTRAREAVAYGTREQTPSDDLALVVRGTLDPATFHESIRRAVSRFDNGQALTNIRSLDRLRTDFAMSDRLRSKLLVAFAVIAIALAAMGLYGVLSYAVVQRTREIGIRAALGATAPNLVTMVIRQGMRMSAWGIALGVGGALVVSRFLATLVVGIASFDPTTSAAAAVILAAVALMACYIPARRAARVDPLVALRCE